MNMLFKSMQMCLYYDLEITLPFDSQYSQQLFQVYGKSVNMKTVPSCVNLKHNLLSN